MGVIADEFKDAKKLVLNYKSDDFVKVNSLKNTYTFFDFDRRVYNMVGFLYDIIDESDYFFFDHYLNRLNHFFQDNLKYETFEILDLQYRVHRVIPIYYYNIKSKRSKKILKETLRFNICNPSYRSIVDVKTSCRNIANDHHMEYQWIYFVKNDKILTNMNLYNGIMTDFREKELWLPKMKNKFADRYTKKISYASTDFVKTERGFNIYSFRFFKNDVHKYMEFLNKAIEDADHFFFYNGDNGFMLKYLFNVKYQKYTYLEIGLEYSFREFVYYFDISTEKKKAKFRKVFRVNMMYDKELDKELKEHYPEVVTSDYMKKDVIYFVKDDRLFLDFNLCDGYMEDYRKRDLWLEKPKDLEW